MNVAVIGTDTGVGKTVVTAALVARLRARGTDARAIKPAQTGFPEDNDAEWVCEDGAAAVRLRTYKEPMPRAVAARGTDDPIDYETLLTDMRGVMTNTDVGVVEGSGGLPVPLSNEPRREDCRPRFGPRCAGTRGCTVGTRYSKSHRADRRSPPHPRHPGPWVRSGRCQG